MPAIYPMFLEVKRYPNSCSNSGTLININEIIEVYNNDTDEIGVIVRKFSRHGIETQRHTLSVKGTEDFRRLTNTKQTDPAVLREEQEQRGWQPRYDE